MSNLVPLVTTEGVFFWLSDVTDPGWHQLPLRKGVTPGFSWGEGERKLRVWGPGWRREGTLLPPCLSGSLGPPEPLLRSFFHSFIQQTVSWASSPTLQAAGPDQNHLIPALMKYAERQIEGWHEERMQKVLQFL